MKTLKLFLIVICAGLFLQSCDKDGKIKIQNNITKVVITDVQWGNQHVAWQLLPGETSNEVTIDESNLPSKQKVSFRMTANNKTVYLETVEEFFLDEDDEITITLTDETGVKNPNDVRRIAELK